MNSLVDHRNPFSVTTPEDMGADDVTRLFVDVFTDFPRVDRPGHVFINGPRGSGKSMMFRFLLPDCQCITKGKTFAELDYLSLYIPLKNMGIAPTELSRLVETHGDYLLNEHFLTLYIGSKVMQFLSNNDFENSEVNLNATRVFSAWACEQLAAQGIPSKGENEAGNISEEFGVILSIFETLYRNFIKYIKKLSFSTSPLSYDGPLLGYIDFLYPMLLGIKELPFIPSKNIYLLLDDADNLSLTQTKILNSWVSTRTSNNVSLKISIQFKYKTYRTVSGGLIETPHDYSDVNILNKYTSSKSIYRQRIKNIVERRLELFGVNKSAEDYFPEDVKQEKAIRAISEKLILDWSSSGKGFRPSDDAARYARPDYIKKLGNISKSKHTYKYAGFDQLVHISSGIVRYFLEAAARMHSRVISSETGDVKVISISTAIQNKVMRIMSDELLFNEFEKHRNDLDESSSNALLLDKLYNLIIVLGGTFHQILISSRSERRVFSIAFSDQPSLEIQEILDFGEERGYFHRSAIGNKDGTGRTRLYILTRQLAPYFNLDPTSFAGYLFVTNQQITNAIHGPDTYLRKIKREGLAREYEYRQLALFD